MAYVIGVEGGGTKTTFSLVKVVGEPGENKYEVVAEAESGTSNINSTSDDECRSSILSGLNSLLSTSNISSSQVKAVQMGMAGVESSGNRDKIIKWTREVFADEEGTKLYLDSDAVSGLASGTLGDNKGVVIISGTGMVAMALHPSKETIRAGGWGPMLGDIGSGFWIGSEGLKAATKASDGVQGSETLILGLVLQQLGLSSASELIPWAYSDHNWKKFASTARSVFEAARQGDKVATMIIEKAASGLMEAIETVVVKQGFDKEPEFYLVLVGGCLTHEGSLLAQNLKQKMADRFPNAKVQTPLVSGSIGAALLAIRHLNTL